MMKFGFLIGCAGIAAATGCVADSAEADVDQTQVAEAELATNPQGPGPNAIGVFHPIRLSNTNLCLQPLGGTTADAPVELRTCNGSTVQHWLFSQTSSVEWEIINFQSGRCLYENTNSPVGGAEQIIHASCNIFGTNTPASNALWRPTALTGNSRLQSRVGHRDTGFCIHVPGVPFDGIGVVNERCAAGNPAQIFVVGTE
jgi:hypothetical protein